MNFRSVRDRVWGQGGYPTFFERREEISGFDAWRWVIWNSEGVVIGWDMWLKGEVE